ncbi:DUF4838 domain-containing protein [Cohnella soli]|uniref:DUF4838 domain-containing protein n=1 Tax=Cohnella soli TaxID=425005 RepID=A0ABW0I2W8_9BACL
MVSFSLCLISSTFGAWTGGKLALAEERVKYNAASVSQLSDVSGHWAEDQILDWYNKDFIKGYQDRTFRPNNKLSRGEMMALVNRAFGFEGEAPISYSDVENGSWIYSEVAKAVKAQYVTGDSNGKMNPQRDVTREEVAVMIARLLNLDGSEQPAEQFSDVGTFSLWSKAQIFAVAHKKIMVGFKDDSFRPKNTITRAEIIVALDRALKYRNDHFAANGGTYGPSTGIQTIEGDFTVDAEGVTLQNMVIIGNLMLSEKIGEGDVYLKNVEVRGHTDIRGGGENSVHLDDCIMPTVTINKKNGTVRIVLAGKTSIAKLTALTPAILDLSATASISSLFAEALIKALGQGTIESAVLGEKAKGSVFEKQPGKISGPGAPAAGQPIGSGGSGNPAVPGTVSVIANGQTNAVIVIADDASAKISAAANTLVEYVQKSTGAQLSVQTETQYDQSTGKEGMIPIYIGKAAPGQENNAASMLDGMLDDGFVILPRQKDITILGAKETGTEFGVYEFLERYVGVRWLLPGEYGDDVPQSATLAIPITNVKQQPAFHSRAMWPLQYVNEGGNDPAQYEWGVRNRLRVQNPGFEHYLWWMFLPTINYEDHPDFYPHDEEGNPLIPSYYYGWQPCFSNEATVDFAVDWIKNYFRDNPNASSISLAVSDNGGFCEALPHHPNYTDKLNSLGLPDMSDIYYGWVNKVVERVLEQYPDKWFGLLAYQEVYDPPSFALNERVVPYLTKDRLAWSDPEVRAHDQTVVDKWLQKASYIGFYDYNYGTPYVLPRIYNHLMADNYRYAIDNNVIASYGELFPNWGEAPKIWLMTKLLWDPEQDVDVLLDDWYKRAVGPEAAPYLKAYYDHWEDFWENRIKETDWFQGRKNIVYFMYNSAAYLSAVTDEEIAQSRSWLESAVAKAQTNDQKARANLLLKAFEYYEASALSYPKAVGALSDTNAALKLLEYSLDFEPKMAYAKKRIELVEQYKTDNLLRHQWDPRSESTLLWSGLNANAFWRLADYIKAYEEDGGPVRQRLSELAAPSQPDMSRNYAKLLLRAVDEGPINLNPSFEDAGNPDDPKVTAKDWGADIVNFGKFERKEFAPQSEEVNSGTASIHVHNFYYGDINQIVDAKTGLVISRLKYFVTEDTRTVGDIWIELNLLDENGQKLTTIKSERQPFYLSLGRWENIQIMDKIPARVNGIPVKKVQMAAIVNGFFEGGTMYLDDYELYQASEAFGLPLLSSAQAEEGTIDIVFNEAPDQAPTAADFSVLQKDGIATTEVEAALVSWNASSLTAKLSIPALDSKPWVQRVTYSVSYRDIDTISTNDIAIDRLPGYTTVSNDPSFEQWNASTGLPQHWWYSAEGISRSETIKRSGQSAVMAQYRYAGGIVQDLSALEPGNYIAVLHYKTSAASNGKLQWVITPKNGATPLTALVSSPSRGSDSNGDWKTHTFEFNLASDYNGQTMTDTQLLVLLSDFNAGDIIYLDDAELIRVDDAPVDQPSVSSVHAEEGFLNIVFSGAPAQAPTDADFTVRLVNDGQPSDVDHSLVSWDANSLTAKLEVPGISKQPWVQQTTYEIVYQSQESVSSNTVAIPRSDGYTAVSIDPSFEQWNASTGLPEHWWYSAEGISRSETIKRSGQSAIVAQYRYAGGIVQDLPALAPGRYIAVFHYNTSATSNGKVQWVVTPKNGSTPLTALVSNPSQGSASRGNWTTHSFEFEITSDYNGQSMTDTQLLILLSDFNSGDTIYFDDAEIIKVN